MKILHLDIETAPNLAHVWRLFEQNVAINQIMMPGYVLCWAAKWDGEDKVFFDSIQHKKRKAMLKGIHALLADADAVVHFNGQAFDVPTLNGEFLQERMPPPSPYRQIDLLKTARDQFHFPSNKLEYLARVLGLGGKVKHEGHELWVKVMDNQKDAWKRMEEYNKHDVVLQEQVYHRFLPWIRNHPNLGLYADDGRPACPNCGKNRLTRRGFLVTAAQKYPRFQCQDCGKWSRGNEKMAQPVAMREAR